MTHSLAEQFQASQNRLKPKAENYAVQVVDELLALAKNAQASDIHLLPADGDRLQFLLRIDGVLQEIGWLESSTPNIISRLKVLANLLTYRTDVPQEGRVRSQTGSSEMRVSTFPTIHGEKAVIRLFVGSGNYRTLGELGYPTEIQDQLEVLLTQTSGLMIVSGPAGSGKTTTLYACLRHIQTNCNTARSICTLEDPIEALLPGISQSQVKPNSEFNYQTGLASLMRQDPEVIMVGEIRDRETAQISFQASLTGQLVLTTFHSSHTADAISRLCDMGIEPYVLRSGLIGVLAQRLMRAKCRCDAGCEACRHTRYNGRIVIAELLLPNLKNLGRAILDQNDAEQIEEHAINAGMIPLIHRAQQAMKDGLTTQEEYTRIFGLV